ncbi:hypothetical protein FQR65_LT00536 [Abscondita terminalis]|nr:hypothetical protein FQR65_LT00536 [Abscondita terminalis]
MLHKTEFTLEKQQTEINCTLTHNIFENAFVLPTKVLRKDTYTFLYGFYNLYNSFYNRKTSFKGKS